jgi:hypothetical protein
MAPFSPWALYAIRYTGRWRLPVAVTEADLLTGYALEWRLEVAP